MNDELAIKLVQDAMEREYVEDRGDWFDDGTHALGLDGTFTFDELEAMVWCMTVNIWPERKS